MKQKHALDKPKTTCTRCHGSRISKNSHKTLKGHFTSELLAGVALGAMDNQSALLTTHPQPLRITPVPEDTQTLTSTFQARVTNSQKLSRIEPPACPRDGGLENDNSALTAHPPTTASAPLSTSSANVSQILQPRSIAEKAFINPLQFQAMLLDWESFEYPVELPSDHQEWNEPGLVYIDTFDWIVASRTIGVAWSSDVVEHDWTLSTELSDLPWYRDKEWDEISVSELVNLTNFQLYEAL